MELNDSSLAEPLQCCVGGVERNDIISLHNLKDKRISGQPRVSVAPALKLKNERFLPIL